MTCANMLPARVWPRAQPPLSHEHPPRASPARTAPDTPRARPCQHVELVQPVGRGSGCRLVHRQMRKPAVTRSRRS